MTTVVIMPGGFHPFHAGHLALYQAAKTAFPRAEVFVAATNDTSARPFPFVIKEKLAQLAGVDPSHFVQVKSPFRAEEITARFDPRKDRLIFVRSEKDSDKPPQPGGVKKDGSPSYLQPLAGETNIRPFGEHAYIAYLPTVEFGPGMTSATEIRTAWPQLNDQRKQALVMSLYPKTQKNPRLADTVVRMLDTAIVAESVNPVTANTAGSGAGMTATYQQKYNQPAMENQGWAATYNESDDYIEEKWSAKYKKSINCANPRGFSQRAHCAGRRKNEDVAEGFADKTVKVVKRRGKPIGEIGIDPEASPGNGSYYVKLYDGSVDLSGFDTAEEALAELKYLVKQSVAESSRRTTFTDEELDAINQYLDDDLSFQGLRTYPGLIRKIASHFGIASMQGHSGEMSFYDRLAQARAEGDIPQQGVAEAQLAEKCWDTHRQVGMKQKGNRRVPNCVPK